MAKEKFEKYTQYDIVGTLDTNENGELIIIADNMEHSFTELLEDMLGQQIQIKCQIN